MCVCFLYAGDNEFCLDQLAFETLVSKSTLHRYVSLLYDHRKLVLHGSSGTGKSYMAMKLAQCIVRRYIYIPIYTSCSLHDR